MKKRIIALVATIIITLPIFTMTASRVQPRWTLLNSATAVCYTNDDVYYVSVTALDNVTRLDISATVYEKGLFSGYTQVSTLNKTVYTYHHVATKSYDFSTLKDYKIDLTVTAYTQSGQTETVTVSEEYT